VGTATECFLPLPGTAQKSRKKKDRGKRRKGRKKGCLSQVVFPLTHKLPWEEGWQDNYGNIK